MPKILEIPDSHLEKFRSIYEQEAQNIINGALEYRNKWNEIEPILGQLGINLKFPNYYNSNKSNSIKNEGNKSVTWLDRSVEVIKKEGRPLTSVEILDKIIEDDSSLEREKVINSVPATLSVKAKEGKIFRFKNDKEEWTYDLIENAAKHDREKLHKKEDINLF